MTFAFRGYSKSVEAHICRSDRRETGNQMGKTEKPRRVPNPKNRKRKAKNGKSADCHGNKRQNGKTEIFLDKNRKNHLKDCQSCKTENPNAPLTGLIM